MKNSLGRYIPEGFIPFQSSRAFLEKPRTREKIILSENKGNKKLSSISEAFDRLGISNNMTLSFHHHLRNGDLVMNLVFEEIKRRNLKNMTIAASSIFPNNQILSELIENGNVTDIYTNYLNGRLRELFPKASFRECLHGYARR